MPKLSVLIPSRNEKYLYPTIHDCFAKRQGNTEVVVALDGYWPEGWKEITSTYPDLHTVHHGEARGLRPAVNSAAASAISRGAKYLMKLDAHCLLDEGFDVKLLAEIEPNWIVVPRRKRLDPDAWTVTETQKLDIDYHYLSFPADPNDFGGPGLNGKVWEERARERRNKPEYDLDSEMSSQGSAWLLAASYFQELELMDTDSYGPFWNEAQELFLKCWLSGGRGVINKKTFYAHLHKGSKHGRGYKLPESWLTQGATFTKNWIYNDAWAKQTLPFSWLIEHFWPVPSWPENWEEVLYAEKRPRTLVGVAAGAGGSDGPVPIAHHDNGATKPGSSLTIHEARYGIGDSLGEYVDVTGKLQSLVVGDSLDIVINNSALDVGNPFRGKRKQLLVTYSYDGGERVSMRRDEKDWLIIGQAQERRVHITEPLKTPVFNAVHEEAEPEILEKLPRPMERASNAAVAAVSKLASTESKRAMNITAEMGDLKDHAKKTASWIQFGKSPLEKQPMSAPALNDYLIGKFSISPQRLRGPMPIELRDFHRNDLAALFAELGFKRGAEIGVAEGKYSEVLLKANPECELLLVDPWHHYSDNPQGKSKEKHEFAEAETERRIAPYKNARMVVGYSMDVVRDVAENLLDFVYIDGNHSYPYVMCDIIEWAKRVRSGGIVALDDIYQLNEKWGAGPMEAIYDYTRAMRINPWFLIDAYKSVDAFFVKP